MKRILLSIGFLFLIICAKAQYFPVGSPIISHFEKTDYHAGTQNWVSVQDNRGILYFGNNKGILEFDGTKWRTFPLPNSTIVRSLTIDQNGKIWVGGQDEFGYLDSDQLGNVNYVSLTPLVPNSHKSFADIWKIVEFDGAIFFYSQRAIFRLHNDKIEVISPSIRFENFFSCQGQLYIQETQDGLLRWDQAKFIPVPGGKDFTSSRITAILPFSEQEKLIVSATQGLF